MKSKAEFRSQSISDVKYNLRLNLNPGKYYQGQVDISFTYHQIETEDLDIPWIDFCGWQILSVQINGHLLEKLESTE